MSEPETVDAEVVDERGRGGTVAALALREQEGALVRPAGSIAEVEEAFGDYQSLCEKLLTDDDHQMIGSRRFRKKSAWRKLAVAFGVSFELVEKEITYADAKKQRGVQVARFVYRAVAPNGRYVDGWGSCSVYERCCESPCPKVSWNNHECCGRDCAGSIHFSHADHDVPATAETRAKNRAASDLFGMGEVSAEEVVGEGETPAPGAGSGGGSSSLVCPDCGGGVYDNRERKKDADAPDWLRRAKDYRCKDRENCKWEGDSLEPPATAEQRATIDRLKKAVTSDDQRAELNDWFSSTHWKMDALTEVQARAVIEKLSEFTGGEIAAADKSEGEGSQESAQPGPERTMESRYDEDPYPAGGTVDEVKAWIGDDSQRALHAMWQETRRPDDDRRVTLWEHAARIAGDVPETLEADAPGEPADEGGAEDTDVEVARCSACGNDDADAIEKQANGSWLCTDREDCMAREPF